MLALGLAAFLLFGAVLVLVGSHQAQLAAALDLDLAASGLLAASLSAGLGLGMVAAGPVVDRCPRRPVFVAAALLSALALLRVDAQIGFVSALLSLALLGTGVGVFETLLNTALAERHGAAAARPLTVLHSAATAGAVLAPPLFAWLAAEHGFATGFRATGVGFLVLAAWGGLTRFEPPPSRVLVQARSDVLRVLVALLPFACVGACYVGIETALTLFAIPYASEALALPATRGITAISAFWLGLLAGRLALLPYRGTIDARLLGAAGAISAALLAAGVLLRVQQIELWIGAIGVSLGSVFPVLIALTAQRFPRRPGTATGAVAGAGALGGFVIPWLTGILGDRAGTAAALSTLAFWSLAIAATTWGTLGPRAARQTGLAGAATAKQEGAHGERG